MMARLRKDGQQVDKTTCQCRCQRLKIPPGFYAARVGGCTACGLTPFSPKRRESVLYHFAECTLDTARYTLHRAGQDIRLSRKVFEVLRYLLAHRDRVVPKQELCDQVWEGVAISDAALESCIRAVRASVGDTGQAQQIIQTHRGYGYQCVVGVHEECASPPELLPV